MERHYLTSPVPCSNIHPIVLLSLVTQSLVEPHECNDTVGITSILAFAVLFRDTSGRPKPEVARQGPCPSLHLHGYLDDTSCLRFVTVNDIIGDLLLD